VPAAPRKPANNKVAIDLTTLDIQTDAPVPVRVAPNVIVHMRNAEDLDWQVLVGLSVDRPFEFFEQIVLEDEQEAFLSAKISGKHMSKLIELYMAHFEIRQGESGA
jgi:hypothetical protein